ncbi:hypothetical protein BaRGS_00039942 [Batillaria attramentaria]|uniref:Uncharacterized protein n=1 Tax=Batillaria attramentaria TaxID=370345 RepID=A0ABD0J201_9CAEN
MAGGVGRPAAAAVSNQKVDVDVTRPGKIVTAASTPWMIHNSVTRLRYWEAALSGRDTRCGLVEMGDLLAAAVSNQKVDVDVTRPGKIVTAASTPWMIHNSVTRSTNST